MLNKSGENGQPCHVPDLSRKAVSFVPLKMILAVGLSQIDLMKFRNVPSIPIL